MVAPSTHFYLMHTKPIYKRKLFLILQFYNNTCNFLQELSKALMVKTYAIFETSH